MAENTETHNRGPVAPDGSGLFAPDGMLRRVLGESIGLLGGGCDLLLQIAHPLVAAGVLDHSHFQSDPMKRLLGTIDTLLGIVFGELGQARTTLRDFHSVHVPVRGALPEAAGRFPAGASYSGHDPELKLWVHASLIGTQLRLYELFVRRLTPAERAQYYEESKLLAWRLGIPRPLIPPTLEDFERYMAVMAAGDDLAITPSTLALSRTVLHPPNVNLMTRIAVRPTAFITTGLLPERLRRDYGLKWDRKRQVTFDALCWVSRRIMPLVPLPLRMLPKVRPTFLFRWATGEGARKPGQGAT